MGHTSITLRLIRNPGAAFGLGVGATALFTIITAVVIGMVTAVGLLPAVLAMLGTRVGALRVPGITGPGAETRHGAWSRIAHAVMRRPILFAVGILGATVMPHVIYLHSSLTADRMRARDDQDKKRVLKYQRVDVAVQDGQSLARVGRRERVVVRSTGSP